MAMTDTDEKHGQKTPAPYVAKSGRTLTPAQARGLKNLLPRPPRPGPGRPKGTSWKGAIIRIGAKKLKEICPDEYALRMATGKPGFGWSRKVIDVAVTEAFRAVILEHNMVAFKILMEKIGAL